MEKNWKVYIHVVHTSHGDMRYIGISKNPEKRWRSNGVGYWRNKKFYNAIKKYGWENIEHIILLDNYTQEEACNKEKELILLYSSNDYNFGYNKTSGGEISKKYNKDTIDKMSKNRKGKCKGEDNTWYGKHLSKEVRDKISKNSAHIRYWSGKHRSEETKEKLRKAHSIPVVQLNKENLTFIKEWESGKKAAEYLHIDSSFITKCCKHKSAYSHGYVWMYAREYYGLKENNKN